MSFSTKTPPCLSLTAVPNEVLVTGIAAFLFQTERYRLFSTSKIFHVLLYQVRSCTFHDESWKTFVDNEGYRQQILQSVLLPNKEEEGNTLIEEDVVCTAQRKLKLCISHIDAQGMDILHSYGLYFESIEIIQDDAIDMSAWTMLFKTYPHLRPRSRRVDMELRANDLHELHSLIVDENHFLNEDDENDEMLDNKHKPLSMFRGIKQMFESNKCSLELSFGAILEKVELDFTNIQFSHDFDPLSWLSNIEDVTINNWNGKTSLIYLSQATKLTFYNCNNMYNLGYIRYVRTVKLVDLTISDLSMLGKVKYLCLENVADVVKYPIPSLNDEKQHWDFTGVNISDLCGYENIFQLEFYGCNNLNDIRMLNKVKLLTVYACRGIKYYPLPYSSAAPDQRWNLDQLNKVQILSPEYDTLYELKLSNCQDLMDISVISKIRVLDISNCPTIKSFPSRPCGKYQSWTFSDCNIIDVSSYGNIYSLKLFRCHSLKDISALGSVQYLSIMINESIESFPIPLRSNQEWIFSNVKQLSDLTGFDKLHNLVLHKCDQIDNSIASSLHHMHRLEVKCCRNIQSIYILFHNIQFLSLCKCYNQEQVVLENIEEYECFPCLRDKYDYDIF